LAIEGNENNKPVVQNLFTDIPINLPDEFVDVLLANKNIRIERIISSGHKSPVGSWYDQKEAEWVLLLKGEAILSFEGSDGTLNMKPGDHVNISPHQKHRVDWTSSKEATVWLAVFY